MRKSTTGRCGGIAAVDRNFCLARSTSSLLTAQPLSRRKFSLAGLFELDFITVPICFRRQMLPGKSLLTDCSTRLKSVAPWQYYCGCRPAATSLETLHPDAALRIPGGRTSLRCYSLQTGRGCRFSHLQIGRYCNCLFRLWTLHRRHQRQTWMSSMRRPLRFWYIT